MEPHAKKLSFVYVCLMNRRLRGGDKAGGDQGVTGEDVEGGRDGPFALLHAAVWSRCQQCAFINSSFFI